MVVAASEIDEALVKKCILKARLEREKILKNSCMVNGLEYLTVPRFDWDELQLGKQLGQGGFSDVIEISSIPLKPPKARNQSAQENANVFEELGNVVQFKVECDDETRNYMTTHCRRKPSGDARYAVKYLTKEVREDPDLFRKGVIDLTVEALFLSSLSHPNILRIRGVASSDLNAFGRPEGYFIVMDRLYDILDQRIEKWATQERKWKKSFRAKFFKMTSPSQSHSLSIRLFVAYHIASALDYMHEHNIVYRDLKPENIGFDVRGDVKLFDFGFAKEIYPKYNNDEQTEEGYYNLSGFTGTVRYMAPEVAQYLPYNVSADVYSFGLLLWEICSLKIPFEGLNAKEHSEQVVYGGKRPKLMSSWSSDLRDLIKACWAQEKSDRPDLKEALKIIKEEIIRLRGGNLIGLDFSCERRSVYGKDLTSNGFKTENAEISEHQ